ncbi:hypothetical protein KO02_16665 [Sphingobacterium sp. ML3W]|uniref:hypothetical protein n=1 Tax=Sphingobacterium sp. ML3W TaxID=1538644 RepID=UPI0004F7E1CB|nr:hypothetical protein [Sphingobacterium sp. ML3W]AIM38126.1 hypothetical protein KO02_16665 [Sphingobacterium sp. ML3W]
MAWYKYNGGPVCDPNSYTLVGNAPPSCPNPNIRLCAIQAFDNMGSPIITPALCGEIGTALQNKTESVNVLLCP